MRAVQKKIGRQVVLEGRLFPSFAGMAGSAFAATMTFVAIVLQMAAGAGHIHDVIKRVFAVTVGA